MARESVIARNYAEALFDIGEKHDRLEAFTDAFGELGAVLADEPRIRTFLETPKVGLEQKERVLTEALRDRVPPLFLNFVLVVLAKRRQALLPEIARAYRTVMDERLGRVHVEVTLAQPPDESLRSTITERLSRMLGQPVIPQIQVEPEILGGIIVRYGDNVMDGSLQRRLRSMRGQMLGRRPGAR